MNPMGTCEHCGRSYFAEQLTTFDGSILCPECLEMETLICADCGDRIWQDNNEGSSDVPLCATCYYEDYTRCTRCGELLHNDSACYLSDDDDDPSCPDCRDQLLYAEIHSYSYKPRPIFYGDGPRYFGVELEIDNAGEDPDSAGKLLAIGNRGGERIYCKHDGSLDEGFEIVTHPMSLDFHLHEMPWAEILEKAIQMGYLSHKANTCGLHVHISRAAFGANRGEQDFAISRVLYFVEKHWNELLRFSRRTQRQLDRWAARYGYKDDPQEMQEHVKKGYGSRYTCVNLTNDATIEFRIFRGTLKYNTLIATLQMVNRICDAAIFLSDEQLKALSWSEFMAGIREPELIRYLKEQRLYLNEPVESEAEL